MGGGRTTCDCGSSRPRRLLVRGRVVFWLGGHDAHLHDLVRTKTAANGTHVAEAKVRHVQTRMDSPRPIAA